VSTSSIYLALRLLYNVVHLCGSHPGYSVSQNCLNGKVYPPLIFLNKLDFLPLGDYSVWLDLDSACSLYSTTRWAVKEAAYKALYPHFRPTWKDLVITKGTDPKPVLKYQPVDDGDHALRFFLSISHDGEYTVATVLVDDPSG
jgi:4'-phosphopantetheinyl transferase superfamily